MSSHAPSTQIYPYSIVTARVLDCLPEEPFGNLGANQSQSPLETVVCGG